ncbi:MAG: acyl-CoA dehydrogenase family protein [Proteobacteria bacterium]|nr:acyl-CoA dehydrogenase family protein [Pseudomonadota bacterium]
MDSLEPIAAPGIADPVAAARRVAQVLVGCAAEIDRDRELPPRALDAMHEAGMFRLLLPRSVGGAELDPLTYNMAVEEIAAGDASAAWCMNQGSGCSMSAAYLPAEAARTIFGDDPRGVIAWGQAPGQVARRAPGGWRLTGKWPFASGSRHATWLGAHIHLAAEDGTKLAGPEGKPVERTLLFPRSAAAITDVWQVMGLRGTGSDTYAVEDLFVPEAFSLSRDNPAERREQGLLYSFTSGQIYASGFAAVAMGTARAALDALIALGREKTPQLATTALRDNHAVQAKVAIAVATLNAARAWLHQVLRDAIAEAERAGALSLDTRMSIRLASTYAIQQSRAVVDTAYHEAGATAIFDANPFERRFRDVNAVTQQVQGRHTHFETVGQWMLGGAPVLRWV